MPQNRNSRPAIRSTRQNEVCLRRLAVDISLHVQEGPITEGRIWKGGSGRRGRVTGTPTTRGWGQNSTPIHAGFLLVHSLIKVILVMVIASQPGERMRLIENHSIEAWAASKAAESRFPFWVKSLITAVVQPQKLRMPSGDAVWLPGYDGDVVNAEENPFVPHGRSVWELGTNRDYKSKANDDYEKRTIDNVELTEAQKKFPPEAQEKIRDGLKKRARARDSERAEATFVFVTPYLWPGKDEWVAERKADGKWNDVRVIDGEDLKNWFEIAPAVSLQFAAEIGSAPEDGLSTPEQAWENWSYRSTPPLSDELVVTGRSQQEKELAARLATRPSTFSVRGHSPLEAWGFALATLRRIEPEEDRHALWSRTIVADNEVVAERLQNLGNLIVILKQTRGHVSGALSARGCHVIVPEGNDAYSNGSLIELVRPSHRQFMEALVRMGLSEEEAEKATRACGLSLTILQRQRAPANCQPPRWVEERGATLLPAVLAGRWNSRNDADRGILCRLSGKAAYPEVEGALNDFLHVDEPPLHRVGEMWTLTAPVDAFQLTARRISSDHLARFEESFREVFGRIDARVEMDPDDWLYHDARGEEGPSSWLRAGMAEALLLIAERGAEARLMCGCDPKEYAARVVRGLPGLHDDWRVLASIRDQFTRLMEAAPDPLLDSLERLLEAKPDDMRRFFNEGSGALSGGAMHSSLLWGLEILAWSPGYLPRVAMVLTKLAVIDPGGRLINRPINSLKEILLWWNAGTAATTDERLQVIDQIIAFDEGIGWTLVSKLMPSVHQSISHAPLKPRWRDIGEVPVASRTRRGQLVYAAAIVDRALDLVSDRPERWKAVLDGVKTMKDDQVARAIEILETVEVGNLSPAQRSELWEVLREFVSRNRTFSDAAWALTGKRLEELERVLQRFSPEDLVEKAAWLFDEWLPDTTSGESDIERRKEEVKALRTTAISEISAREGVAGIMRLGLKCKYPGFVAEVAVDHLNSIDAVRDLITVSLESGDDKGQLFASQASGRAEQVYDEMWRAEIVEWFNSRKIDFTKAAILTSLWRDNPTTWDVVRQLGNDVADEYWRRKPLFLIDGTPDEQQYQIEKLISVERAAEAMDRLAYHCRSVPTKAMFDVFDAALAEIATATTGEELRAPGLNSSDIAQFLVEMRSRDDAASEEVAKREYQALPLLGHINSKGLTIHEFMSTNPTFFIDVICDVFLPANRDKTADAEPTPHARAKARVAYQLLQGMEKVPGLQEDGSVDGKALIGWIEEVRRLALDRDRATVTDLQIGNVLAHAPDDPLDGAWPHSSVRDAIDLFQAEDINRGISIERHNMRGVYSKALYEGGVQERELAAQYRWWSKACAGRWMVTSRMLDEIANSWERDAEREDLRAQQDRLDDNA